LERIGTPPRLKVIVAGTDEANLVHIADVIYDSFRSYKNDRCAVFLDEGTRFSLEDSGIDTGRLDPRLNLHWQGGEKALRNKTWKRIMTGSYLDWFQWYMRWQRFNAFHTVLLFKPVSRLVDDEARGFMDGFLTRMLNKPSLHRAIIVEESAFLPVVRRWIGDEASIADSDLKLHFGKNETRDAILCTLYGTRLSRPDLVAAVSRTLSSKLNPDWESVLAKSGRFMRLLKGNFRVLDEDGAKIVQSLGNISSDSPDEHPEYEEMFHLARKREHLKVGDKWIEELIHRLTDERGWFTIPLLYERATLELEEMFHSGEEPPQRITYQLERVEGDPPLVNLPSQAMFRRIAERVVTDGQLARSEWFREVGRPSTVYQKVGLAPFDQEHRCGQCAFYASLRRRCRLWWLLDKAFTTYHPRWTKEGAYPLPPFELYKMKNSWRISPHSSACSRFKDKKKDHSRNDIPESCEVCNEALPESRAQLLVCKNCRTRYVRVKRHVRIFTAYEHEFERNYREIAGRDSASDITRLEEERLASPERAMEQIHYEAHHPASDGEEQPKTLMIYPGDRMLVKDGRLYIFKRRNVESVPLTGTTLIDNDVIDEEQLRSLESAGAKIRKVPGLKSAYFEDPKSRINIAPMVEKVLVESPELARGFAIAMAKSAVHATERIAALPQVPHAEAQSSLAEQRRLLGRLEKSGPNRFLTYEALIMKEYWKCFNLPLRSVFERFGPRKRSRFVRESVTTASGRARGYSAVDAAINYLHQRRLFKCRQTNMRLGLDYNPGEGFLHRRRWNSDGLGLILDLIDPFKFADREKLLEAVSDSRINWRDFYSSTDRHGMRFYYPKPEAVGTLEAIGDDADRIIVKHDGRSLPLMEVYQVMVSDLIESLKMNKPNSFTPFEY
jgi:CRISPR/Cas system-associated endonuclease Cas1